MAARWTLEPGRTLVRDGVKVARLDRYQIPETEHPDHATGAHALRPSEADDLAREIVAALNIPQGDPLRPFVEQVAAIRPVSSAPGVPATMWHGADVAAAVREARRLLENPPWNPRYVAYAIAHGRTVDSMLEADAKAWPGGKMAGFITWNSARLGEFRKAHPEAFTLAGLTDHAAYDAWLFAYVAKPAERPRVEVYEVRSGDPTGQFWPLDLGVSLEACRALASNHAHKLNAGARDGSIYGVRVVGAPDEIGPGEFERAKLAGYDVEPDGFGGGYIARDPDGDEIEQGTTERSWPGERAAWEACDRHRMFGTAAPFEIAPDGDTWKWKAAGVPGAMWSPPFDTREEAEADARSDTEPDTSDIPEAGADWFARAKRIPAPDIITESPPCQAWATPGDDLGRRLYIVARDLRAAMAGNYGEGAPGTEVDSVLAEAAKLWGEG